MEATASTTVLQLDNVVRRRPAGHGQGQCPVWRDVDVPEGEQRDEADHVRDVQHARVYVGIRAVLSLCASGRMTGVILVSGGGVTRTVPHLQGFLAPTRDPTFGLCGP